MDELARLMTEYGYLPYFPRTNDSKTGYFRKASSAAFECFVYFRYLTRHRTHEVSLGVQSVEVRGQLNEALRTVYGDEFSERFLDVRERPCLSMFNADELMNWPAGQLYAESQEELSAKLSDLFHEAIEPTFESVSNDDEMLDLLLNQSAPFEWWRSSVSPRVAQIVALSFRTARDWKSVRESISFGEHLLLDDILVSDRTRTFVDDLCQYFEATEKVSKPLGSGQL